MPSTSAVLARPVRMRVRSCLSDSMLLPMRVWASFLMSLSMWRFPVNLATFEYSSGSRWSLLRRGQPPSTRVPICSPRMIRIRLPGTVMS